MIDLSAVFYSGKANISGAFIGQRVGVLFFPEACHVVVLRIIHGIELIGFFSYAESVRAIAFAADSLLKSKFAVAIHNKEVVPDALATLEIFCITPFPMAGSNQKLIADTLQHDSLQRLGQLNTADDPASFADLAIERHITENGTTHNAMQFTIFINTHADFVAACIRELQKVLPFFAIFAAVQTCIQCTIHLIVGRGNIAIFIGYASSEK